MVLTKEDLELFYRFYKEADNGEPMEVYAERLKTLLSGSDEKKYKMFAYLVDLLNLNHYPQVVKDEKYNALPTEQLYHGAKEIDHIANLLADFDYHKGCGLHGTGVYTTVGYQLAFEQYAYKDMKKVLHLKLNPTAKIIDGGDLYKFNLAMHCDVNNNPCGYNYNMYNPQTKLKDSAKKNYRMVVDFCREHKNEPDFLDFYICVFSDSVFAILLGYDAVKTGPKLENYYVILNRGKIVVSESEFKRITNVSKNYKNGVVDFESKSDYEFLRE